MPKIHVPKIGMFTLKLAYTIPLEEQYVESISLSTRDYTIMKPVQATNFQDDVRYIVFRVYSDHACHVLHLSNLYIRQRGLIM